MNRKVKVLFFVNGKEESSYGIRARSLAGSFSDCAATILYRKNKLISLFVFISEGLKQKPDFIYLMNIASSGAFACLFLRIFFRIRFISDTGDVNYELFKITGKNKLFCAVARVVEESVLYLSSAIIVRGRYFKEYLQKKGYNNVYYVPDGVDTSQFRPADVSPLKEKIAPNQELVIGLIGSLMWSKPLQYCYGLELIKALNILKSEPVKAVIIGSGSGQKYLKEKISEYGIADKVVFVGRLAYNQLPEYINAMDVCTSTQINYITGWVRTPGKLPLYLACGKYTLSTDVGDAHYILPDEMKLDYNGLSDPEYAGRLASAILRLLNNRSMLNKASVCRDIAIREFDYKKLSKQTESILLKCGN